MRKWIVGILLCMVLSALCLTATAEGLSSVTWQGYTLTPQYYALSYNSRVMVRVSCDAIPLEVLTKGMADFVLTGADNGKDSAAAGIVVLSEYIYGAPEGETEFFDIVFITEQMAGDLQVRLGLDGPILSVPLIDDVRDRCCFRTESGAYVLSFFSEEDAENAAARYSDAFNGQDVTLFLEESFSSVINPYSASDFLQQFRFASLRLFTSATVGKSLDAGCVTELGLTQYQKSLPVFPNVKRLTLWQDAMFPSGMAEAFPALEEMKLYLLPPYAGRDLLTHNDRPPKVVPSLKALRVSMSFGDIPTDDPDFRLWLEAQRTAVPDMTVNGMPAKELDLSDGLSDDYLEELRRVSDDLTILSLYGLVGQDVPQTHEAIPERLIVAVIDRYDRIESASTDRKPAYDFDGPLAGRLAASLEEADAVAIIYPVLKEVGKYGGSFSAYSCEARLAVIDLKTGTLLLDQHVVTNQPPQSTKLGSGKNAGSFDVPRAIGALADALK